MLPWPIESISSKTLAQVCEERWPESQTLDFKERLPTAGDQKDRQEYLKDVCAFANGSGGDLVYGVAADGIGARALVPISQENADSAERRLRQLLDSGVEPPVTDVQMRAVPVDGGFVLIVRAPASFSGPHRFLNNAY